MDEARERVNELASRLQPLLRSNLAGLYLFGSLAAGGFYPGRSDVDLLAVVERGLDDDDLEKVERFRLEYVEAHPAWDNRIEIGFVSRTVLQTFAGSPSGTIAVLSPGEPLHHKPAEADWVLNWYGVCTQGEVLYGPPPFAIGPEVPVAAYKRAIASQLPLWSMEVRERSVAHSRSYQGYIVLVLCRALYGLATGKQTTKEGAAAWAEERFPEWAEFIEEAVVWHRADLSEPHATTIRFVDFALDDANRMQKT